MSSIQFKLQTISDIPRAIAWVSENVTKGIAAGCVVITLGREKRSNAMNAKMWPMLEDIAKKVIWFEQKHTKEDWKDILSAAWKGQKLVPGINGGFVALGVRTSNISKPDFSEFIESLYAFGSEHEVEWSEKALEVYAEYRESQ